MSAYLAAAAEPVLADRAPKPGDRLTASTITDDQLDALYAERDQYAAEADANWKQLTEVDERCDRYAAALERVRGLAEQFAVTDELGAVLGFGEAAECIRTALVGPSEPRTAPTAAPESHAGLRGAPEGTGGPR